MRRFTYAFIVMVLISFFVTACAPTLKKVEVSDSAVRAEREKQQRLFAENTIKQQFRLNDISGPILCEAVEFAPKDKVQAYYGFNYLQRDMLSKEMGQALVDMYSLGVPPKVVHIVPGSPADKSGLQEGDQIQGVNGKACKGKECVEIFSAERKRSTKMSIQIARGNEKREIAIEGIPSYSCPVLLSPDQSLNAYADGSKVVIFMGIMNAFSDAEVSIIVGHELSHNLLDHLSKKKGNAAIGTVADAIVSGLLSVAARTPVSTRGAFSNVGAAAYSKEFEGEADYMGLYLSSRAGCDISQAAELWRKMALTNPGSIKQKTSYFSSHPSSPERYLTMEQTIAEIQAKKEANKPLIPDKRE